MIIFVLFCFSRIEKRFYIEKQYDRRQASTQVRSAKSNEVINLVCLSKLDLFHLKIFHLIDRKLQTGVHGVRHMFRSNDRNQEGKLSK